MGNDKSISKSESLVDTSCSNKIQSKFPKTEPVPDTTTTSNGYEIKNWSDYQRFLNQTFRIDNEHCKSLQSLKEQNKELYDIIIEIDKQNITVTRIRNKESFIKYGQEIYNKHKSFIDKYSRSNNSNSTEQEVTVPMRAPMMNSLPTEAQIDANWQNNNKKCEACIIL